MDAVVAGSRRAIAAGSRSFAAASRLFDAGTRESAHLLYAWCRHCDDEIDGQELGHGDRAEDQDERRARLRRLYVLTEAAFEGHGALGPEFEGLRRVVRRHGIPRRFPIDLLDGFAMDVEARRFRTIDDTLRYCYHVAGAVGVMMALVMGVRDDESLDRASDLGIAFQLTNVARDVVDDARHGRIYLPLAWLEAEGLPAGRLADPARLAANHAACEWVARPEHAAALARVTARLLAFAEPYYASARAGLVSLPFRSAWAVATARGVYRDIGRLVQRRGARAWEQRAVVGPGRKVLRALEGGVLAAGAVSVDRWRRPSSRVGLWTRPDGAA
jgi:15-cis-phytoene synthase